MKNAFPVKFVPSIGILALLGVILYFLGALRWIDNWELETLTLRQRVFAQQYSQTYKGSPDIALVSIDEASQNSPGLAKIFGRTWMNRAMYGYAIRFFNRTQARRVIFDMSFNGGSYDDLNAGDQAMVQSLDGTHRFISALVFERGKAADTAWSQQTSERQKLLFKNTVGLQGVKDLPPSFRQRQFASIIPPFVALLKSPMQFYAANEVVQDGLTDDSGLMRRWFPFAVYQGRLFPTMALGALLGDEKTLTFNKAGLLSWGSGRVHLGPDLLPIIKWYGNQTSVQSDVRPYQEYHFWDVLESELVLQCRQKPTLQVAGKAVCQMGILPARPRLSPDVFKNRIVLINTTQANSFDNHPSVFGPGYPGVYVVANALDNILRDDFVQPAPWWMNAFFFLAGLGLTAWLCFRFQSVVMVLGTLIAMLVLFVLICNAGYAKFNIWINMTYPSLGVISVFSGSYIYRYLKTEKLRQQLRFAFGKYVSPAVMYNLEKNPNALQLGGHRRELTLLFCDIRGFTSFSENNDPETIERFLLEYFSVMNHIIKNTYQGSINKLMGDAIMAYWGFPLEKQDHALLAVQAAMAMRDALVEWHRNPQNPPLKIGIGINTGDVVIGNIGSDDFMDFTVIGDAVNLASRLESLNKEYGSTIIISASTYEKIRDRVTVRSLGRVKVRGKEQEIDIYEPLSLQ